MTQPVIEPRSARPLVNTLPRGQCFAYLHVQKFLVKGGNLWYFDLVDFSVDHTRVISLVWNQYLSSPWLDIFYPFTIVCWISYSITFADPQRNFPEKLPVIWIPNLTIFDIFSLQVVTMETFNCKWYSLHTVQVKEEIIYDSETELNKLVITKSIFITMSQTQTVHTLL